ncbi:MAG: L,D-transpeptidase family protein, partial [Candidatus Omnitrophota bacterium]
WGSGSPFFFADERKTMKKNNFLILLISAMLFIPAGVFAAGTDAEDATGKTLAALETSPRLPATELPQDDQNTFKKENFTTDGTKPAPIATVSDDEKIKDTIPAVKAETVRAEVSTPKTSPVLLPEKKAVEVRTKTEVSSTLNPAELQRRWKALFSKEIASDSIAYTVKSGDSLYVLARKNHTTVDFIKKINDLKSDNIYPRMKLKIHTAPFSIRIDKSKNVLVLYSNDEAVKKYSVATGKKNCTPVGEFKITDKLVHPTWFKTGAILPPGSPENALGARWMGFDKPGYGIHGTIEPKSIGTQASEGCIRMLNEEVEELYSLVPVGTKVIIQD